MPTRAPTISFDAGRSRPPDHLYDAPHWYACSTRSRHEKSVDELLRRQSIESYLPTTVRESLWKDRRKLVEFALFPGYVFGCFTLHQLTQVLSTRGVAAVVSARGVPNPIPAREIESVRILARAAVPGGPVIEVDEHPLVQRGVRVRVAAGPFLGVEGIVVERRGRRRVLVGIAAIGQGVNIEIALSDLDPIPVSP